MTCSWPTLLQSLIHFLMTLPGPSVSASCTQIYHQCLQTANSFQYSFHIKGNCKDTLPPWKTHSSSSLRKRVTEHSTLTSVSFLKPINVLGNHLSTALTWIKTRKPLCGCKLHTCMVVWVFYMAIRSRAFSKMPTATAVSCILCLCCVVYRCQVQSGQAH